MFKSLKKKGFNIAFTSHAQAILEIDFSEVAAELENILLQSTIPIEEIIGSGGGETKGTQRLRAALKNVGWRKHCFVVKRIIDDVPRESQSHEVDHVKPFPSGTVALEIEWNNKDPFFDRDLENFKRLHSDGAISVGIIITRGAELQVQMRDLVAKFAAQKGIEDFDDVRGVGVRPTSRQINDVMKRVERLKDPLIFRDAWVDQFVSDKFGAATTHWKKLEDRLDRGVGNPCPLVIIGLPPSTVTFEEKPEVVQELIADGAEAEE
jgi:hypothetical protein